MQKTYLFYDIETTGLSKCFDQIVQFAAIRTDTNLNELERHEYYVKLNEDTIPSPSAFLTHCISPSKLITGISELEAVKHIHSLFNTPHTVSIGYNTLGFDDEFLRFSFYRNLLPPYTHQYANGCSRMDLYPMTVMYYLFNHSLLTWPEQNLKLENISFLNNLATGPAHDAMTDVLATLNLAKRLYKDEKMWHYISGYFDKKLDLDRTLQIVNQETDLPGAILADGKFGASQDYQCYAAYLGTHQQYKNQQLWLRLDTSSFSDITPENFVEHTWVINKKMGETYFVLPTKERFIKPSLQKNMPLIQGNLAYLNSQNGLLETIKKHYLNYTYPKIDSLDVNGALYEQSFPSSFDQESCQKILSMIPDRKMSIVNQLTAPHLQELAIRMMGRHYYDYLPTLEQQHYQKYIHESWIEESPRMDYAGRQRLTPKKALNEITELEARDLELHQRNVLQELKSYFKSRISY